MPEAAFAYRCVDGPTRKPPLFWVTGKLFRKRTQNTLKTGLMSNDYLNSDIYIFQ